MFSRALLGVSYCHTMSHHFGSMSMTYQHNLPIRQILPYKKAQCSRKSWANISSNKAINKFSATDVSKLTEYSCAWLKTGILQTCARTEQFLKYGTHTFNMTIWAAKHPNIRRLPFILTGGRGVERGIVTKRSSVSPKWKDV